MNRDYDIGRFICEEFYRDLHDSFGNLRKTTELTNRDLRRLSDVIMSLIGLEEAKDNLSLAKDKVISDLDNFLGTFKIIKGVV